MKFSVSRKMNLANIDRDLWPYETEDIGVTDAHSFEEAQQAVEKQYNIRIGYYRALAESSKNKTPDTAPTTTGQQAPVQNPTTQTAQYDVPAPASDGAISNNPPPEFN